MAWLGHMFRGLRQTGGKKPHQFCKVGSTETCPMSSMSRGKPTGVKPGGQTACIDSRARYVFEVIPGDTDKLLIFFQGGGACWDEWSTTTKMPLGGKRGFCSQRPLLGTFNHELTQTVFRGYTVVHVNYCSGDAHVGSVTRPWRIKGAPVKQHGYYNARAAIDWAKANVAARLSSLALMGCSAGALGVGAWAHRLLGEFSYERASVVADSYIGIFPAGATARVVQSFGTCDLGLLAEPLASRCQQGDSTLTYPDMLETAMRDFPGVGFANINSKQDRVQILFYNMVAYSFREVSFLNMISYSRTYYTRLNRILERYSGYPNYVSFLVNGVTHCFTCTPLTRKFRVNFRVFGEAGPASATGGGEGPYAPRLATWLREFLSASSRSGSRTAPWSVCAGEQLTLEEAGSWSKWLSARSQEWCDVRLARKALRLQPQRL